MGTCVSTNVSQIHEPSGGRKLGIVTPYLRPLRTARAPMPWRGRFGGGRSKLELLSLSSCSCSWSPWRSALRTGGSSHHPSSHNCSVVVCSTCFVCAGLLCVVGRGGGDGEGEKEGEQEGEKEGKMDELGELKSSGCWRF